MSAEVSVKAMLRFVKRDVDRSGRTGVLSQGDIEDAQKLISKAIDVVSDKSHQCGVVYSCSRLYTCMYHYNYVRMIRYLIT